MRKSTEREFERIAKAAVSEAEGVKCSLADFVEGLGVILDEVKERKAMADDEIRERPDA